MKRRRMLFALALALIAAGILSAAIMRTRSAPPAEPRAVFIPESFDFKTQRARWASEVDALGAEAAYERFKTDYRSKNLKEQHIGAHIFGDILYAKKGLDGFRVCDAMFAFGCYHIFLTRALAERGAEAILMLSRICEERFGARSAGCEHGIGHGILEYFGYSPDGLRRGLETCPPASDKNPFVGCLSGVFMEYYSRVSFDQTRTALEWREFDPRNPYDPCPSVPKEFARPCYAQLGLWWDTATNADYRYMGELCGGVGDRGNRDICFFSLGMFGATLSGYDGEETLSRCAEMPSEESTLLCRAGAHRSFRGAPYNASDAQELCADLGERVKECMNTDPELL